MRGTRRKGGGAPIETAEPDQLTRMWSPSAVATDGDRTYVADAWNQTIWELAADGRLLPFLQTGEVGAGNGGPREPLRLQTPGGLTVAPDGRLYVSDTGNHLVRCIDGDHVRSITRFRSPGALAATPDGAVLVAEHDGLRRLEPDGRHVAVPVPPLVRPAGIAVSTSGVIYIADAGSERVIRVSPAGVVSTVAGAVDPLLAALDPSDGEGGPAFRARLRRPAGIAADGAGGLIVVERDARRVRRILPDGTIATVARLDGQAVIAGTVDGAVVVTPDSVSWLSLHGDVLARRVILSGVRVSKDTGRSFIG